MFAWEHMYNSFYNLLCTHFINQRKQKYISRRTSLKKEESCVSRNKKKKEERLPHNINSWPKALQNLLSRGSRYECERIMHPPFDALLPNQPATRMIKISNCRVLWYFFSRWNQSQHRSKVTTPMCELHLLCISNSNMTQLRFVLKSFKIWPSITKKSHKLACKVDVTLFIL